MALDFLLNRRADEIGSSGAVLKRNTWRLGKKKSGRKEVGNTYRMGIVCLLRSQLKRVVLRTELILQLGLGKIGSVSLAGRSRENIHQQKRALIMRPK